MNAKPIANRDYLEVLESSKIRLKKLKDKKIFLTGATGFFGKWIMQVLIRANKDLDLNTSFTVLTRDPDLILSQQTWLEAESVNLLKGDIKDFDFPEEKFDFFIHAATAASASLNNSRPDVMADTIIDGTRKVLKLAELSSRPRFLFVSSGAVYGQQPSEVIMAKENLLTGPEITKVTSSYAEAKRMAELYCQFSANSKKIDLSIARCFAFLGPYLPLDQHFAAGNFLKDILEKKVIKLTGDGSPYRSYMYPTDLVNWLLTILVDAPSGEVYNVGSEEEIKLKDLASLVDSQREYYDLAIPSPRVLITGETTVKDPRNAYVPSVKKASQELGLEITVNLNEAIKRTLSWHISK